MVSITLLTLGYKNMSLAYVRKDFAEYGFYYFAYFWVQKYDFAYVRKVFSKFYFSF